jgi:uncharacterized protein Yka (UPF0111/DUF47 family)
VRLRLSLASGGLIELVDACARNVVDAAVLLADLCDRYPERLEQAAGISDFEQRGDEFVAELSRRIERTLATPIDARDLVGLAVAVDVADDLVLLRPATLPEEARAQAVVLLQACERIADATARLHRLPDLSAELDDVRRLEDEGDRLRRVATAKLFCSGLPPVEIMRLKRVHEALEAAIDATRAVADRIAVVVIKHRW